MSFSIKVHLLATAFGAMASSAAMGQTADPGDPATDPPTSQPDETTESTPDGQALLDEIVVTGTKKNKGELLQDVPASVTALGQEQIAALKVQNLESLSFTIPNVQLDQLGTQKGIANFTVRGLGVNSSVPSIEPTVGTFVNGVYMGTNFGVVVDVFDLDGIEVFRGPQGVLFGRNVTGGAVLLRTVRPRNRFEVDARVNFETGLNQIYAAAVSGPLSDNLRARMTGYYNHDAGYFDNVTTGRDAGRTKTWFARPTIVFQPLSELTITLIGEHGEMSGDGPTSRNPSHSKKFDTAADYAGYTDLAWNSIAFETVLNVSDTGAITNIAGYRDVKQRTGFDVDAGPNPVYNLFYYFAQDQFSNEIRYSDRLWDRADVVAGLYYFTQDMTLLTRDDLLYIGRRADSGGTQDSNSLGVFANVDVDVMKNLTLGLGGRYSRDRKDARAASRVFTADQPCNLDEERCSRFNWAGKETFSSFTPRVALVYDTGNTNIYATYSKGFRSGGFNIRSSSPIVPIGPFGDEKSDSFEVGVKSDLFQRRLRLNLSAFYNKIKDLQRETSVPSPAGFVTVIGNAADAKIKGLEGEILFSPISELVFRGAIGITDGKYTRVFSDLNGDRVIDERDRNLEIPRLAPLTYSVGVFYDSEIQNAGKFGLQVNFDHRASSFFNDANTGPLPAFDNLFASASFSPHALKAVTFTLYGKNLLNSWNTGNNTPLGTLPGGGFIQFPVKGRVFGVEARARF